MSDALLKKNENCQNEIENFETDDKEEELQKKKKKSRLIKSIIITIALILIIAVFICYKFFFKSKPNAVNSFEILDKYNNLGKKDDNLVALLTSEHFLERRERNFMNIEIIFHLNKDDVDKDKLLKAIKLTIENQGIFHSLFYIKNNKFYVKFDNNLYPEIVSTNIKESDYQNYLFEIEQQLKFSLNKLLYKVYVIQTEKSVYCTFFFHHAIFDKMSLDALVHTLNNAYASFNDNKPFKNEDYFYARLYEYNLKLRNEKNTINDIQKFYFSNYDLGRTFKGYHFDKDIQKPLTNLVLLFADKSDKGLRDKIHNLFNGDMTKMSMFNMICQIYNVYLYNNMEDPIPEIAYVRHGRNLKYYRNSMGAFLQISFIKYDFSKYAIKKGDKKYLNVQHFYDNAKSQFDEQKLISGYHTSFENYDLLKGLDNLSFGQMYRVDNGDSIMPKYLFGKKLLENTKGGMIFAGDPNADHLQRLIFQNVYSDDAILNYFGVSAECYKIESLKKISTLFYKVADALSDGLLSNDKLIEIKMLD